LIKPIFVFFIKDFNLLGRTQGKIFWFCSLLCDMNFFQQQLVLQGIVSQAVEMRYN